MTVFDLDDFCDDHTSELNFAMLRRLKHKVPTLKVTLFTIPGRISRDFFGRFERYSSWVDFVQHGWFHPDNYECKRWKKEDCVQALKLGREMGFTTKGFKAPGWQISDGCYEALLEEGYWLADQPYNNHRVPDGLPVYQLTNSGPTVINWTNPPKVDFQIHGHVGHLGGYNANALELIEEDICRRAAVDSDFRFIRECFV